MSNELVKARPSSGRLLTVPAIIADAGETAVAAYHAYLNGGHWSDGTRKSYDWSIHRFCRWARKHRLDLEWITPAVIETYATEVAAERGRHAADPYVTPVKGLYRQLSAAGIMTGLAGPLPQSTEDWQTAVDAAHVMLTLDSMKQYGLIDGGPKTDLARCRAFLSLGSALGYAPAADAFEQIAPELIDKT
jgi:hypothetical protein